MQELKTLGTMLQNIVENEEKRFSLHEFLLESTEEDRKEIKNKLIDEDRKQFFEYMDWYTFVNESEINMAVCEYVEHVNDRPLSMWEMGDISEIADDYIREKNLTLDDDWNILPYNQL